MLVAMLIGMMTTQLATTASLPGEGGKEGRREGGMVLWVGEELHGDD